MEYLSIRALSKSYAGARILDSVSLDIDQGSFVSLIGRSGSGKTTLFHLLSGLEQPDSGSIYLEGADITGQTGHFSYMQQKDLLLGYNTVLDNICIPLRLRGLSKQEARAQAQAHLAEFGLSDYAQVYPHQISGGMRQRAALLRAYLYSDRLMLLDEPFSQLDFFTRTSMQHWYKRVARAHGTTTLLITHEIEEALLLSDKIYVLSGSPATCKEPLEIDRGGMSDAEFAVSEQFLRYKQLLMNAVQP